eukprot:668476-Rhodomonas_salina.6
MMPIPECGHVAGPFQFLSVRHYEDVCCIWVRLIVVYLVHFCIVNFAGFTHECGVQHLAICVMIVFANVFCYGLEQFVNHCLTPWVVDNEVVDVDFWCREVQVAPVGPPSQRRQSSCPVSVSDQVVAREV